MLVNEEHISLEQQALYENEALRENLDDDEAEALLKWGEACIARLGQAEEVDFGAGCQAVRRILAAADKLVARADLEEEIAHHALERLAESAPLLGLSFSAQQVEDALPDDPADRQGTVEALLALLQGGASAPASTEDEPPPSPPDEATPPSTPGERLNQVIGRLRGLLGS